MNKKEIILFIQNYFSQAVSYDDDDNMSYFFSYVEKYFNLSPQEAFQYSIDLFYRFMIANLAEYVYWDLESEEHLRNDICKMIKYFNKFHHLDDWYNYFKPTKIIEEIIHRYDLISGYYDENTISVDFEKEITEILEKKGIGLDIYPLVDIGYGGVIVLTY